MNGDDREFSRQIPLKSSDLGLRCEAPEGALRFLVAFLEDLIEQNPTAAWIADSQGTMIKLNQACRDLFHVTDEDVVNRYNVLHDNVLEEKGLMPQLRRVFDCGETAGFEVEYDSSRLRGYPVSRPVKASLISALHPVKDAKGGVCAAIVQHIDFTARKAAEEALRLSEARLVKAQAVAHVGNWEIDLATRTMWASEEAFRIYGSDLEPPYVSLDRVQSYVIGKDRARMDAALEALVNQGGQYDLEFQIGRPIDGELRTLHSIAELVCDGAGVPVKVIGVVQDVTEQRRIEERLRLTEYSVDHALDSVFWVDYEGRLFWVSDATCRTLGYTHDELLAMTLFDVDRLLSAQAWAEGWARLGAEGAYTFETVHVRKDGSSFPVEVNVNHVVYEGVEYNCVFARDISDRKRSESNTVWLSRILDESLNEVYAFDPETLHFVTVNQGARRNLGYSMDELTRMTPVDLKPAYSRETFEELIAPLRSGAERQVVFETDHRRKDGSLYPVEVHLKITEHEPRPMFLSIIEDITERRAAQEALRASEEQLRQSQKMEAVGLLAGGIAHDFNNLLTAIMGYSDLLLARVHGDDDRLRPDLEEIKSAAERASALTNQILAFSRRQTLLPRVVSLNDVLTGWKPLLQRTLGEPIDLVTLCDPALGLVEIDVSRFEQVLMNLAVNARDAMPLGGRMTLKTENVELDAEFALAHPDVSPGGYVALSVIDTGHGMDELTMARIYDPFFTTKAVGKGTGLGLSTVYGIVRQSGGIIVAESALGKGSRFTVYLPRVFVGAVSPEAPVAAHPSTMRGGETVLVVEDEAAVRRLAERILAGLGYRVVIAGTGEEGLVAFRGMEAPPDLVLTDMVLPGGMHGHDLAEQLRLSAPGLPVLYMSGYAPDTALPARGLGEAWHFLPKPFTPEQLGVAVREALDARPGPGIIAD